MVLCSVVAVGITACNKEKAPTPDELNRNITAYTNNLDEDEKVSDSEDNKTADKENKKSAADKELDNSEGKARKSTKVFIQKETVEVEEVPKADTQPTTEEQIITEPDIVETPAEEKPEESIEEPVKERSNTCRCNDERCHGCCERFCKQYKYCKSRSYVLPSSGL